MSPRQENERALVVQRCLDLLDPLDDRERARVLRTVATYFEITVHSGERPAQPPTATRVPNQGREPAFSGHDPVSAKEFLRVKAPKTDVERAMCLAYYLAHYKDMPSFKTSDIAKLNTEAAQRKFANTAYTINNGSTTGYFVAAPGGNKQLSSFGEQYVDALPDRQAARAIVTSRSKRKRSKTAGRRKV